MANIQSQDQRIDNRLQIVDYTPTTNAAIQTGAFKAQQQIAANTRKINKANKAMAEFKQKSEQRQLSNETAAYIAKLGKSKDPTTQKVMQSLAVNTEDPKEIKGFMNAAGGPTEALKLINDTADATRNFQVEILKQRANTPQATYIKPEDVETFQEDNNIEITSLTPATDADGNTVLKVGGTKPIVEEESKINIPETETWAFDAEGNPQVGKIQGVDADGDGVDDFITIVEQSATGEFYLNTREAPEKPKSLTDIKTEEAVAGFGKTSGELAAKTVEEFRKKSPVLENNIFQYERMLAGLKSGEVNHNKMVEFFPDIVGTRESLRAFFTPTTQDTIDRMVSVVFQNLRETLGAQFTAKEAQQFLDAAYNSQLEPEINIARMEDALDLMTFAYQEQAKYVKYLQTPEGMANPSGYPVMPGEVFRTKLNKYYQDRQLKDQQEGNLNPTYNKSSNQMYIIKGDPK